jgi:hypothetical protein
VKNASKYALRCPQCLSSDVGLWLGGWVGLQTYRCHKCGFIGGSFIEIEEESMEALYKRLMKVYRGSKEKLEKDIELHERNGSSREGAILRLAIEKGITQ